jgi:integrase
VACIRKRRGKYVVDYRDGAGIRRWVTCETRREAETVLLDKARDAGQPTRPSVDPNITVSAYAERWLREVEVTIKPKTRKSYDSALRLYILPALGLTKVRMLQKGRIKSLPVERLRPGQVNKLTRGGGS